MFKKIVKYCMMFYILVAFSVAAANPHMEADNSKDTFDQNISDDLVFYMWGNPQLSDERFRIPAVLRFFVTPTGARVQLQHINEFNAQGDTKTIWFQNDKRKKKDTSQKSKSEPQAK